MQAFLQKYEKLLEWQGECLVWTGNRGRNYGRLKIRGVKWRVHRFVYTMVNGPIPPGICVCHSCDNPPCCNPKHLFLGTNKENSQDMVRKGRVNGPKGIRNRNARFTDEQIVEIKSKYIPHVVTAEQVGLEYGMNPAYVRYLCSRRSSR